MSLGFDTCMNNYTTGDLLSLLDLGSNPSYMEITNKVNIFTDMFSTLTDISENVQNEIVGFFENIQDKLLDDISNNTADNANEYNYFDYNIENPMLSQLPLAAPNFEDDNDLNPENLIQCYDITEEEIDTIQTHQEDIKIVPPKTTCIYHKNYHFSDISMAHIHNKNTTFRYTFTPQLNNVSELYLASIKFPMPYNISSYLNNNKFCISDSSGVKHIIDLSDQYFYNYIDLGRLVEELNGKFTSPDNSNNILHYITASATTNGGSTNISDLNSSIRFDLSLGNPISSTFTLNFDVSENPCSANYKLNTLFNLLPIYKDVSHVPGPISSSISKVITYNQFGAYISLNDYTFNYNQNLEVINNNNNFNDTIAYVSFSPAQVIGNSNIFSRQFNISEATQNNRTYNGNVSLLNFEIKFIDLYGNLLQIPPYKNNNNFNFVLKITSSTGCLSPNEFSEVINVVDN
tara:strand:+ start:1490 stop:2872 length:1383 start_codon:yes stop_codon:yes gene_type:complete